MVGENKNWFRRLVESNPVLVRGVVVAVFGLIAMGLNMQFASGTVENVANGIISVFALISSLWARPAVTPNTKVVSYMPRPDTNPSVVLPGKANDSVIGGVQQ
jgi:hypothetical protein